MSNTRTTIMFPGLEANTPVEWYGSDVNIAFGNLLLVPDEPGTNTDRPVHKLAETISKQTLLGVGIVGLDGYGRSYDKQGEYISTDEYSTGHHALQLGRIIRTLRLQGSWDRPIHLYGEGYGAYVAAWAALSDPDTATLAVDRPLLYNPRELLVPIEELQELEAQEAMRAHPLLAANPGGHRLPTLVSFAGEDGDDYQAAAVEAFMHSSGHRAERYQYGLEDSTAANLAFASWLIGHGAPRRPKQS